MIQDVSVQGASERVDQVSTEKVVKGIIQKLLGGFYYVAVDEGVWCCRARGLFRKAAIKPLVGDSVLVQPDPLEPEKGYIVDVLPRTSELLRPSVANVNQAVIVFALTKPKPNFNLLDKLLVFCEVSGVSPLICLNKMDLDHDGDLLGQVMAIYKHSGYRMISSSTKVAGGAESLREALRDRITVFAGPSGVGKSSLVNAVIPGLGLVIGEVSEKIERGKHTTRHTELIGLPEGGYVLDTPGFTSLELSEIEDFEPRDLKDLMPEFEQYQEQCRFDDCQHINEPGCEVIAAVAAGEIHTSRYESYLLMFQQLSGNRRKKSW